MTCLVCCHQYWCFNFEGDISSFPADRDVRTVSAPSALTASYRQRFSNVVLAAVSRFKRVFARTTSYRHTIFYSREQSLSHVFVKLMNLFQSGCGSEWRRSPRPRASRAMKRWVGRLNAPLLHSYDKVKDLYLTGKWANLCILCFQRAKSAEKPWTRRHCYRQRGR